MKYKISNTADQKELVEFAKVPIKFPELYKPQFVITGKKETIVPIITEENTQEVSFGIWGILPNNYNEDWADFQSVIDTLTIKHNDIENEYFLKDILKIQRCLILVTGFFTTYFKNGKTHQYYASKKGNKPFYLAGCYSKLEDGFLTFALLLKEQDKFFEKIQNLTNYMPMIVDEKKKELWFSDEKNYKTIVDKVRKTDLSEFEITLIDEVFCKKYNSNHSIYEHLK